MDREHGRYIWHNSSDLESQLLPESDELFQVSYRDLELSHSLSDSEAINVSENESMPPLESPADLTS